MTKKQFKEINVRLKKWRDDRHLDLESQRDGLVLNLLEELVEFGRAKNDVEKVDALCDMYVFLLNSYPLDSISPNENIVGEFPFLLSAISNFSNLNFSEDFDTKPIFLIDRAKDIAEKLEATLRNLGYESYLCLCETIKEIESRTGKYDANAKKWIKDSNMEWYVADYSNCKLDSKKRSVKMAKSLYYKNMSEEELEELIAKIKAFSGADFVKAMNDNKEVFESEIKEMDSKKESKNV